MERSEAEAQIRQTISRFENGYIDKKTAIQKMKNIEKQVKASKKMSKQEKKELAHRIIKIILEILLQIITLGLPALLSGGKNILKINKK